MKSIVIPILVITALLGSSKFAFSADQPFMQAGLENLKEAAKPASQPTPLGTVEKIDRSGLLNSAKESLDKAPLIYKGRKADAEKFISEALEQLKAGQESKALATIQKAISKVIEGIELVDNNKGSSSNMKSKEDSSSNSGSFFGELHP